MGLPNGYVRAIGTGRPIWLVIMGRDPYPTKPTGIPFHKKTWEELLEDDCSGGHVLRSLGFKLDGLTPDQLEKRYGTPCSLFLKMAKAGIVFLNLVYPDEALKEKSITRKAHSDLMRDADTVNGPICREAWLTVLCGQAKKRRWLRSECTNPPMEAVHPDTRNRKNTRYPWVSQAWYAWWSQDAIFNWVRPVEELHANLRMLTGRE